MKTQTHQTYTIRVSTIEGWPENIKHAQMLATAAPEMRNCLLSVSEYFDGLPMLTPDEEALSNQIVDVLSEIREA